jgi:hypothetical protein
MGIVKAPPLSPQAQNSSAASSAKLLIDRDLQIIRRLARGQLISLEQLRALFWADETTGQLANTATVRARLRQLVTAGYMETGYTNARKASEQVYWLRHEAILLLTEMERERCVLGQPPANKVRELLDAQDAWAGLEVVLAEQGRRLLDWRTERELRSDWGKMLKDKEQELGRYMTPEELAELPEIADAEMLVQQVSNGAIIKIAVEVDGHYTGKYLANKLAGLKRLSEVNNQLVLYATSGGPVRAERLKRDIGKLGANGRIVVVRLGGVASGGN